MQIVHESFYSMTQEDQGIVAWLPNAYENSIADRNDAAVMLARTVLASRGCRASRDRAMPVA